METKLTLKLDKKVIQSVKIYAEKNNRSLSRLVEDYFRNLVMESDSSTSKISPLVQELSGVISESDLNGINYTDYLESKYE
ncbi:hypothetical protein MASR2M48_33380 [Spirochaetota bacterium]|jgi:hypothetical protein